MVSWAMPRWTAIWGLSALCLLGTASTSHGQATGIDASSVVSMGKAAPGNGRAMTVDVKSEGDSSRKAKQTAIEQMPMALLSRPGQQAVKNVLDDVSLFRRLPTIALNADRRVYEYFTAHPDAAVSLWRAMDISRVQMRQTGPNEYETDTRDGTWGQVEVLLRNADHYIIMCRGSFQSPALKKPIQASAVMHLQPKFGENGATLHTLDLFVTFPSQTIETMAKLISPVSNRIADRNFEEVSLFIVMMSAAMQSQPMWVQTVSQKMDGVLAERPQELMALTATMQAEAERVRNGGRSTLLAQPAQPIPQQAALIPPAPR